MARPRKPTILKEITGSYIRNPERRNRNEPRPEKGIGPAPRKPSANWRKCWDEIVSCVCPGVLGDSDRLWLERAAKLLAASRRADFTNAQERALQTYLSRMGMNPSDRTRIEVEEPRGKDPADEYF